MRDWPRPDEQPCQLMWVALGLSCRRRLGSLSRVNRRRHTDMQVAGQTWSDRVASVPVLTLKVALGHAQNCRNRAVSRAALSQMPEKRKLFLVHHDLHRRGSGGKPAPVSRLGVTKQILHHSGCGTPSHCINTSSLPVPITVPIHTPASHV